MGYRDNTRVLRRALHHVVRHNLTITGIDKKGTQPVIEVTDGSMLGLHGLYRRVNGATTYATHFMGCRVTWPARENSHD